MKRSVNGVAVIIAGMAFSALGCATSSNFWNPLSGRSYSDDTKLKIARIQEQEDKLGKARQLYEELYRENPKNVNVVHRLAIVAARMNDPQQSDRYFQEAIRLAPERADLLADYGYALFRRNDLKRAESLLKRAVAIEPANKRAANNLAIVLGHQGRAEESLAAFRRVVGEAEAQANLAYIHVQRGEGRQAVARYNRALEIDKNLHKASHALLQLAKLEQRYLQSDRARQLMARAKARKKSATESTETIAATKRIDGKSIPVETAPIQLTAAKQPHDESSSKIRQANFEQIEPKAKTPEKRQPKKIEQSATPKTVAATPHTLNKPEWLQDAPVKKSDEQPKVSAAAPFPQTSIEQKPVAPKPQAETPKPAVQHAIANEPEQKPIQKSDVPRFEVKPQTIQQMSFTQEAKPAVQDEPATPTFKLTPRTGQRDDPAFRRIGAQINNPRPSVAPIAVAKAEKFPAKKELSANSPVAKTERPESNQSGWAASMETRIPTVSGTPGESTPKGFVPTRPREVNRDQAPIADSESPFAVVEPPARVPVRSADPPARVHVQLEAEEAPARISIAPKAARIRLAPDSE